MKILITGATGVLGAALCKILSDEHEIIGLARHLNSLQPTAHSLQLISADITDKAGIDKAVIKTRPDIIIHSAAYTDVDDCELNFQKAEAVNSIGTENVALAARKIGAILFYISTDHVFDGYKKTPYIETDTQNPINIYGATKLNGEKFIKELTDRHIIIRTSWIFGERGKGFVNMVIARAKKDKIIKIADDKFSTPTYNMDLAEAIDKIINLATVYQPPAPSLYGTYHITNEGSCSWYEYAKTILKFAGIQGVNVIPIKFEELKLAAKRPMYSVLDKSKYNRLTGIPLRIWQNAVKEHIKLCYNN